MAAPGDFFTADLGGQPIIVLRSASGELAALSNLCAHRGTLLMEDAGKSRRFQCPYHAWTDADDGRLLAAPLAPELDRTTHGLDVYRVDEWHGLVFATMPPEPRPLRDRLAHIEHEVVAAGIDGFRH